MARVLHDLGSANALHSVQIDVAARRCPHRHDRRRAPKTPRSEPSGIVLAESDDSTPAVAALKEGARGYCSRSTDPFLIRRAVHLVRAGELWVGRKLMLQLVEELAATQRSALEHPDERLQRLTGREHEIIRLVSNGASNKEIAGRLVIAEKTVKTHLTNIFEKTGLSNRVELAICALRSRATTKVLTT